MKFNPIHATKIIIFIICSIPILGILILLFGAPIFEYIDNNFYNKTPYLDRIGEISVPKQKVDVVYYKSTYYWNGEGNDLTTIKLKLDQVKALANQVKQHPDWENCRGKYVGKSTRERATNAENGWANTKDCYCWDDPNISETQGKSAITFCPNQGLVEIYNAYF